MVGFANVIDVSAKPNVAPAATPQVVPETPQLPVVNESVKQVAPPSTPVANLAPETSVQVQTLAASDQPSTAADAKAAPQPANDTPKQEPAPETQGPATPAVTTDRADAPTAESKPTPTGHDSAAPTTQIYNTVSSASSSTIRGTNVSLVA